MRIQYTNETDETLKAKCNNKLLSTVGTRKYPPPINFSIIIKKA